MAEIISIIASPNFFSYSSYFLFFCILLRSKTSNKFPSLLFSSYFLCKYDYSYSKDI